MKAKVLWFDHRDGEGIVVDAKGNEFYINVSVIKPDVVPMLKSGVRVTCKRNKSIEHVHCAKDVELETA